MKTYHGLLMVIVLFTFFSCQKDNTLQPTASPQAQSKVAINFSMKDAPVDVARIVGILTRAHFDTIMNQFTISNDTARCFFPNVAVGVWYLQVNAYDQANNLKYSGGTEIQVFAGITTPVNLVLNPATGSISVSVTWGGYTPPPPPPLSGLVAYYPLNGNANDASGNGHNGVVNGATPTTDRFGNSNSAYKFNGSNNNIVAILNELKNDSAWTIAAWVKIGSFNRGGPFCLLTATQNYYADGFWWHFMLDSSLSYRTQDMIAGESYINNIQAPLHKEIWQHHVITITKNLVVHYLNGERVYSWHPSFDPQKLHPENLELRIGEGYNFEYRYPLDASIDQLYLFGRLLTDTEVRAIYLKNE